MDQAAIGKFISQCRKEKHLTQAQLAERLGVSDRAVSKWETGRSMPDASIMLDLCEQIDITVNDLFNARRINMDNYKEIAERNKQEARESEKILEEEKKKQEEEVMWQLENASMDLGIPRGEMDWSEGPEDKFGYEEYKRATEKRRNNVKPKKLTEKENPAHSEAPEETAKTDASGENGQDKTEE